MAYQNIGSGDEQDYTGGGGSSSGANAFTSSVAGTSSRTLEAGAGDAIRVNKYETSLPIRVDIEAALTYLFGCVSGVLFIILEVKNDYVRFHAWQSSMVFFGMLLLHIIFIWQNVISFILLAFDLLLMALLMFMAYKNAQETLVRFELPLIGPLASKWVDDE